MQLLTPEKIKALEIIVGVRRPAQVSADAMQQLVDDGLIGVDRTTGAVLPTDSGVRATAPQYMKGITP